MRSSKPLLEIINTILAWALAWILLWQGYILLFNRGVPNIKTAPAIRQAIIEHLKQDLTERGIAEPHIYDLGSGNGHFSREIAQALPQAQITGFEISKWSCWRAETWRKLKKIPNLTYRREDFFESDLSSVDAIVFFLSAYEMGRMGEKLKTSRLKSGTLIISNRFALHNWEPAETLTIKTNVPKQGTVYVYRKQDA